MEVQNLGAEGPYKNLRGAAASPLPWKVPRKPEQARTGQGALYCYQCVFIEPVARSDKALCFQECSDERTPWPGSAAERGLSSLGVSWRRRPFPYDNAGKRNGPRSLPLDQIHRSCYTQHSFAIG